MDNEESAVVNEAVVADATQTDSTPVENKSTEVAEDDRFESGEMSAADLETDSKPAETVEKPEEATPADETKESAQPLGKADERKQQLNTEIRDLVAERNAIKQEVERLNAKAYQPVTEDQLLDQVNPDTGEYYTRMEAKFASMEQRQEVDRYTAQVADSQYSLATEAERALNDFPMFDSQSPDYNPVVAQQVDQMLANALVYDQRTGQVIGSHVKPYQLYKSVYDSAQASAAAAQLKGQRATEQMLANAEGTANAQRKEPSFEKLSVADMRAKLRKQGHDV